MVFATLAKAIFGSANDRQVKRFQPKVDAINALEPQMEKLSDGELSAKTAEFRARLEKGESLDDLLVEVTAASAPGWFHHPDAGALSRHG